MATYYNLRTLLEKHTLNGSNFNHWRRNLKIVLMLENIEHVIEEPPPKAPAETEARDVHNQYERDMVAYRLGHCIMLGSVNAELQAHCETRNTWEMFQFLKDLYKEHVCSKGHKAFDDLSSCKMKKSETIEFHGERMIGYLKKLDDLGFPIPNVQAVDIILHSLPTSFFGFVIDYYLHNFKDTPSQLINKLKTAEKEIKKDEVLEVKKSAKGKKRFTNKQKIAAATGKIQKKKAVKAKGPCFFCGEDGHWKRKCKVYLEHCKKHMDATVSGIF